MLVEYKQKLTVLKEKADGLHALLHIEEKRKAAADLEAQSADSAFWQNPEKAKNVLIELKSNEKIVKQWEALRDIIEDLLALVASAGENEDPDLEAEIKKELDLIMDDYTSLEVAALLSGEYDKNSAILSINAGAGGTDAQDWAQILMRMYSRYAEAKGFSVDLADVSYGEEAGIKSATIIISGVFAYGYLKTEKGVHRLVRMSPFNADGKRHTSFASVEVIPEINDAIKVEINPADLRVDTFRASGAGGQHVNKTDSAVRITHIPTNIVAQSQSDRSQHANRESAMKILKARLYEELLKQHKKKIEDIKGEKREIGWGSQIRSYVFAPYTMVKDHRTNFEISDVNKVIDGYLDPFIEEALKHKDKL